MRDPRVCRRPVRARGAGPPGSWYMYCVWDLECVFSVPQWAVEQTVCWLCNGRIPSFIFIMPYSPPTHGQDMNLAACQVKKQRRWWRRLKDTLKMFNHKTTPTLIIEFFLNFWLESPSPCHEESGRKMNQWLRSLQRFKGKIYQRLFWSFSRVGNTRSTKCWFGHTVRYKYYQCVWNFFALVVIILMFSR